MTLRSRTAPRRGDRSRESGRRTFFTNLAFGLVIVVAVLMLVGYAGITFYTDHFASVATVNGHAISKDALRDRYAVDIWRLNKLKSRIRDEVQAGRMTKDQADQQIAFVDQQLQGQSGTPIATQAVGQLVDAELQSELAASMGISVSDADVDSRLGEEATTTEQRHVWMIEIRPDVNEGATESTAAQKKAAQDAANVALSRLKSGQKWEDVARVASTPGSDDQGYLAKDSTDLDPKFIDAVWAIGISEYTPVIEGADGNFRIGRVTDIDPQVVDPAYQQSITNGGISLATYRQAVKDDLVREALQKRFVDDATTKSSEMREVSEIVLDVDTDQQTGLPITEDQVKVRHILYTPEQEQASSSPSTSPSGSPGASPSGSAGASASPAPSASASASPAASPSDSASPSESAAPTPIPSTDPAWAKAKARAEETYATLKEDPSKFAEIAKRDSADTGSAANGGDLDYFTQSQLDPAFGAAVFAPGLVKDQLLPPVASSYGWHVIQFIDRKQPASTRASALELQLAAAGSDFAAIAKAQSTADDASKGGAMGWVAHYQLDQALEDAIFKLDVGKISDPVTDNDKIYIFKVTKIATQMPDADQITALKSDGFTNWYAAEKAKATITTDPAFSSGG